MQIGMVGLGRMGAGLAERLRRAGIGVVGYDLDPGLSDVASLEELVGRLEPPRVLWLMLPAGAPTESTLTDLAGLAEPGDLIVDGGNSNFRDSIRRGRELGETGIGFVDAGVSGGVWGLEEGYCLMLGGRSAEIERLRPALQALAPPEGLVHAGDVGSGHFAKMVHNGIEYGLMQAYGEGYELMAASELGIDADAVFSAWRHGSVVRSWLLDLLAAALDEDPGLDGVPARAADSGEGRWAVREAVRLGVPVPVMSSALYARFASQERGSLAMKVVAALRHRFGGHRLG